LNNKKYIRFNNGKITNVFCPECNKLTLERKWNCITLYIICRECNYKITVGEMVYYDERLGIRHKKSNKGLS